MDRGAWRAIVHGVSTSWIQLSMHAHHVAYAYDVCSKTTRSSYVKLLINTACLQKVRFQRT